MGLYRGKPYNPKSTLDEGIKGFFKKEQSPADKGFEAARHEDENSELARLDRKKKLDDSLKEKVRLQDEKDAENKKKKENEITFETLHKELLEQRSMMQKMLDEEKEENISSEEDHEFVESVEAEDSGAGDESTVDVIRFRHTDVVIIVSNGAMWVYESEKDYSDGNEPLFDLEFEEMEKIDISDPDLTEEEKKELAEQGDNDPETEDEFNKRKA